MRSVFVILIVLVSTAQAQTYLGLGGAFTSGIEYGGLNIRGQFDLFNIEEGTMTAVPNISQYTPTDDLTRFEFNLDFHNMLGEPKPFMGYLIAGIRYDLDVTAVSPDRNVTTGELGVNMGMGIQYKVVEDVKFFIEGKYLGLNELNRFQLGTGFSLALGKNK